MIGFKFKIFIIWIRQIRLSRPRNLTSGITTIMWQCNLRSLQSSTTAIHHKEGLHSRSFSTRSTNQNFISSRNRTFKQKLKVWKRSKSRKTLLHRSNHLLQPLDLPLQVLQVWIQVSIFRGNQTQARQKGQRKRWNPQISQIASFNKRNCQIRQSQLKLKWSLLREVVWIILLWPLRQKGNLKLIKRIKASTSEQTNWCKQANIHQMLNQSVSLTAATIKEFSTVQENPRKKFYNTRSESTTGKTWQKWRI